MKGTEALALALRRSADRCYAVPGYPVSGIAAATGAAITTNEKVALEYALGDSLAGRRAAVVVKHVGLNACADPLVHATAQGLRAGVVVIVGDDVRAVASDVTQDSRYYGEIAWAPVLEPDGEALAPAVEAAFEASEIFSRVAIIRVTPDLLDADVPETSAPRSDRTGSLADPGLTMAGRNRGPEDQGDLCLVTVLTPQPVLRRQSPHCHRLPALGPEHSLTRVGRPFLMTPHRPPTLAIREAPPGHCGPSAGLPVPSLPSCAAQDAGHL